MKGSYTVSYKDVPHAAVNELMKWLRKQEKQVISMHTWPNLARWSSLPDWSAHIEVRGANKLLSTKPLHARIKRKGYRFIIVRELDAADCPNCAAKAAAAALLSHDALLQTPEPALVAK